MSTPTIREYAEALVADWEPLTAEQQDKLYVLFTPMRDRLTERRVGALVAVATCGALPQRGSDAA